MIIKATMTHPSTRFLAMAATPGLAHYVGDHGQDDDHDGLRRPSQARKTGRARTYRMKRLCRFLGTFETCRWRLRMSASLIGHLGSSTFRLSTTAMSMSLAGSCFSSESAPGPFHHGIRGRGGTIFWTTLPSV